MPKTDPLRLTVKEQQIVELLFQDNAEPAIAARLGIGHRTVNQHVRRVLSRHDLPTRLALVRAYGDRGYTITDGRKR